MAFGRHRGNPEDQWDSNQSALRKMLNFDEMDSKLQEKEPDLYPALTAYENNKKGK
jgi:hypothetical protein